MKNNIVFNIIRKNKKIVILYFLTFFINSILLSLSTQLLSIIFSQDNSYKLIGLLAFGILSSLQLLFLFFILRIDFTKDKIFLKELIHHIIKKMIHLHNLEFEYLYVMINEHCQNYIDWVTYYMESIALAISFVVYLATMISLMNTSIIIYLFLIIFTFVGLNQMIKPYLAQRKQEQIDAKQTYIGYLNKLFLTKNLTKTNNEENEKSYSQQLLKNEVKSISRYNSLLFLLDSVNSMLAVIFQLVIFVLCIYFISIKQMGVENILPLYVFSNVIFIQIQYFFSNISAMNSLNYSIKQVNQIINNEVPPSESNFYANFSKSIEWNNIHLKYDKIIFDSARFAIKKKDKVLVIGGNGSGKSSLVHVIQGLAGQCSLVIDEKYPTSNHLDILLISNKTAVFKASFEDNVTLFHSVPMQNLEFGPKLQQQIVKLSSCMDCSLLSGGEKQVLALVRALNMNFSILILDEFDYSLDIELQREILEFISQLPHTMIYISHHVHGINKSYFNRIYEVKETKIWEVSKCTIEN